MSAIDVLAAMDAADDRLNRLGESPDGDLVVALREAREAVRVLIVAHERIAELDPAINSEDGFSEWGEADCFRQAQTLSRGALAQVQP